LIWKIAQLMKNHKELRVMTTFFPNAKPMLKGKNLLLLAPLTLILVLTMTSPASAAPKIITFDAPNSGTAAGQGTEATGINLEGTITGNVTDSGFGTHGFVRTPDGRFTDFDAPGADPIVGCTCPNGINDLGVIAGNSVDTSSVSHGFLRTPDGQFVIFDDSQAPAGTGAGQGTTPVGIADFGVIAGNYADGNYVNHGFVRTPDGKITTFDPPGSVYTLVWSINNFGQIAGIFFDTNGVGHGFVRTADGRITTFDPPGAVGGAAGTYNAFINDFGVIAGSYYNANTDAEYGYLRWSAGRFTKFAAPKASTTAFYGTELAAINLLGAATGWIFTHSVVVDGNVELEAQAFVRDADGNATTFEVPGQIRTANPYLFGSAGAAINAEGAIAGRWHDVNYVAHAFLRTP
jgi:hypothetical protein